MLRHFYKMVPFFNSGRTYPVPLCTPTPSPQSQCCTLDPQVFFLLQTTLIQGWRHLRRLNRRINEIVDKSTRFRQVRQLHFSLIVDSATQWKYRYN